MRYKQPKHDLHIDTPSVKKEPFEREKPWRCWDIGRKSTMVLCLTGEGNNGQKPT